MLNTSNTKLWYKMITMLNKKLQDLFYLIEPVLLFSAFFLPGYLTQANPVDRTLFDSAVFNIIYIAAALSETGLILYILSISRREITASTGLSQAQSPQADTAFSGYGLSRFRIFDIVKAAGIFFLLLVFIAGFSLLGGLVPGVSIWKKILQTGSGLQNPDLPRWFWQPVWQPATGKKYFSVHILQAGLSWAA